MSFSIIGKVGFVGILLVALMSCGGEDQKETRSGLNVNLIRKGEGGPALKDGVARLHMYYETEDGRPMFDTKRLGGPVAVMMTDDDKGLLDEVVDILEVGDSVSFKFPAEDLYEKTYGLELPDSIQRGTNLVFNVSLHSTMTTDEHQHMVEEAQAKQMARWQAEAEAQLEQDVAVIDEQLDAAGTEYLKLESGVRIVLKKKGKGDKPQLGEKISVYYEGRYFTNDEVFDKVEKSAEPYTFPFGSGVIDGWTRAFAELTAGSSATIYVPSTLGYGNRQYRDIPANSILVFDVDFVKIGD